MTNLVSWHIVDQNEGDLYILTLYFIDVQNAGPC